MNKERRKKQKILYRKKWVNPKNKNKKKNSNNKKKKLKSSN